MVVLGVKLCCLDCTALSSEERMLPVDRWRGHVVDVIVKRDGIDQGRRWGGGQGAKGNCTLPPLLCVQMDFISVPVDRWRGQVVSVKNLEEKDGQRQLLYYVSLIRACNKVLYRGSPTSTVSTSTISTSTIFIAIGIKSVLEEFSRICYVVKFVLVEITM